jgi:hypothetical protein
MMPFRTEHLANGMDVEFVDLSNRYFGDYHRVCVEVRIIVKPAYGAAIDLQQVKRLERMGVASGDVETVRSQLAEDFWRHAGPYLGHPDYPERLAAESAKAGGTQPGRRWPG